MILRGLEILSMVEGEAVSRGDLRVEAGRIVELGARLAPGEGEAQVDLEGLTALPGFVQGHVHLCQTLFRNLAEDLPLLAWLSQRIWPLEAAHDEASLRASARLALFELVSSGTTTFQSMETVHGTDEVFDEILASGLRAISGNALMDRPGAPAGLGIATREALDEAQRLRRSWDGREGRLHFAYNPRFLLSCTPELLAEVGRLRRSEGVRVHTHASEHPEECAAVERELGTRTVEALAERDLCGESTSLAHAVHLDEHELEICKATRTALLHCPTTNLKLGSGVARVSRWRELGLRIALGSDGAPANNRLDTLGECRQAALGQALVAGPGRLSALDALALATREGARALGLDTECGTIEVGKAADLCVFDLRDPRLGPGGEAAERLCFAASRSELRHVLVGGRFLLRDGVPTEVDPAQIAAEAGKALSSLCTRAGLAR